MISQLRKWFHDEWLWIRVMRIRNRMPPSVRVLARAYAEKRRECVARERPPR